MKILFGSNSIFASTGYGNQSKLVIPRLAALGHDVAHHAWYGLEGGPITASVELRGTQYPIRLYPKYRDGYGNDIVSAHAQHFGADVVISLIDAWVLNPAAHKSEGRSIWSPWFPIDHEPIPPPVLRVVREADCPIVYSKFGERQAQAAGLDVRYVPHCVDTARFNPGSQAEARAALGWPSDRFIFGMVAANKGTPSRKAYPQQLEAFARFSRRHTDALLYLHTNQGVDDGLGGVNLPELCEHLGITDKVRWCDTYSQIVGFPDDYMVSVYRAMDCLLSVSMGEGFGIPIMEAQACGTPVLVGDWTSMGELVFGGYKVAKEDAEPYWTPLGAYQYLPHISAIAKQMEQAYNTALGFDRAAIGRDVAAAYDADLVAEHYWRPLLDELATRRHAAPALQQRLDALVRRAA
jgi:glycosyltransferase involved in cell wall biosynthesis